MKSRTLFLIVLFLSVFQTGKSQHTFPSFADSAKWSVLGCNYGIGVVCNTFIYQYAYDTTFCGHLYSKINTTTTETAGYIRSDSSRVYLRATNSCTDKEYLMYDFSMNVGDTVNLAYQLWNNDPNDTTRFVLDSSNTVNFNGVDRRIYYIKYEPDSEFWPGWFGRHMVWIEGIGSISNPFYPIECIQDFCESSWQLLCYDSLGVQLYQDPFFNTCDTAYTALGTSDLTIKNHGNVFPNPTSGKVKVEIEGVLKILIYNQEGKLITEVSGKSDIDLNPYPPGMYFMKIFSNKDTFTETVILLE
jgi:hypothetical protein